MLATVGVATSLETWPVDPTNSLASELAAVGWIVLLGATPVGAANRPGLEEELLGVGSTTVSGTGPVEPTELAALLKVGERGLLGISPVDAATLVRSLPVLATEEDSEKVGEASSVSGRRPVEATKVGSAGVEELVVEEAKVGEGSSTLR